MELGSDDSVLKWHTGKNLNVGDSLENTETNSFVIFVAKITLLLFRQCVFGGIFSQTLFLFFKPGYKFIQITYIWFWFDPSLYFLMMINYSPHWFSILQVNFLLESSPTCLSTIFPAVSHFPTWGWLKRPFEGKCGEDTMSLASAQSCQPVTAFTLLSTAESRARKHTQNLAGHANGGHWRTSCTFTFFLFVITYKHYLLGMECQGLTVLVSLWVHRSGNRDNRNIVKWPWRSLSYIV